MDQQAILEALRAGLARHQAGDLAGAEPHYQCVLVAQPSNPDALHLLGVLEGQRGRLDTSLPLLQRAAALAPNAGEFQRHLGEVLAAIGRADEALAALGRAIHLDPRDAHARHAAGELLLASNRVPRALEQFRLAWELDANNGARALHYGAALLRAGRADEGIAVLRRATELSPDAAFAWHQLADALWQRGRYEEALAPARRTADLAPDHPNALVLLGNTLQTLARFAEAADAYRRAQQIDPDSFDAQSNLALTLLKMGRAREALAMYDEIVRRWPANADAASNRSLAVLTLGDLASGFREYEQRWRSTAFRNVKFAQPRWDGSDPRGKTVLLVSEQGLGDTIHFVRYAPLLAARGARVVVGCTNELARIVRTVPGVHAVHVNGSPLPPFDAYVPMASLPALFQTTEQTIPARVPYVAADPDRVNAWRARLADAARDDAKVAIAWAGSPMHQNDRARSCGLADFAPLAAVERVTFLSLQKGAAAAQAANPPPGMRLIDVSADLHDFADTAALLEAIDLLVSVDTSVVHLAGALARPVWNLLAAGPDWRWMLSRADTPWYPTMRLFRQPEPGAWAPVMHHVARELHAFVQATRARAGAT